MEFGSEFHFDLANTTIRGNTIYHLLARYNTFYTDYGRTAIALVYEHLAQTSEGRRDRILLPSYICESVIEPFKDKNIIFYDLKENFEIEEQGLYKLLESGNFDGGVFFLMEGEDDRRLLYCKSSQMDADTGRCRYLQHKSDACYVAATGTCQDFLQDSCDGSETVILRTGGRICSFHLRCYSMLRIKIGIVSETILRSIGFGEFAFHPY